MFDFFRFMSPTVGKRFPLSSTPSLTKYVNEMLTIRLRLRPAGIDEIQILGDLIGKDPRTSGEKTEVPKNQSHEEPDAGYAQDYQRAIDR